MSRRHVLGAKIVEHDLYLDSVSIEALIHLSGLDEVADVCHSVRMGTRKTGSNATVLHANSTEEHLTHVTLCRCGRIDRKQIFAVNPESDLAN
jgi:hypothetical protein